jgi:hypothetical protein
MVGMVLVVGCDYSGCLLFEDDHLIEFLKVKIEKNLEALKITAVESLKCFVVVVISK